MLTAASLWGLVRRRRDARRVQVRRGSGGGLANLDPGRLRVLWRLYGQPLECGPACLLSAWVRNAVLSL